MRVFTIPLAACGAALAATGALASSAAQQRADLVWLDRITYAPTSADLADFRREGRRAFARRELDEAGKLPAEIQRQIDALEISRRDGADLLNEAANEQKRIAGLPDGDAKEAARKALNDHANALFAETQKREILRAIYSPAQLREQLVWFWLNQFSVHQGKANVRWLAADYAETAVRPHVLGHFADLVLATMQHPAMLQYLDNAQSAVGHLNENYARELLELHTLGVGSGYTQKDVQELARVLTGLGVSVAPDRPKLKKEWEALYVRRGAFEFNPARHDFGEKALLGARIAGSGLDEARRAVDLIVAQPACGRFVARRLATYFVADDPAPALVERMARTFQKTHGDLRAVVESMIASKEFESAPATKLRDPQQYVVASLRVAYEGRIIVNTRPIVNWLNAMGEPLFGRQTPDGYPLVSAAWSSSGQLARRFEIARAIGSNGAGLFQPDGAPPPAPGTAPPPGFPQLATRLYYDVIEPRLSADTRTALDRAPSQAEWNTYLLSSPELNSR